MRALWLLFASVVMACGPVQSASSPATEVATVAPAADAAAVPDIAISPDELPALGAAVTATPPAALPSSAPQTAASQAAAPRAAALAKCAPESNGPAAAAKPAVAAAAKPAVAAAAKPAASANPATAPAAPAVKSVVEPAAGAAALPAIVPHSVPSSRQPLRYCYEAALKRQPGLSGRAAIRFVIQRDGSVGGVCDAGSTVADAEMLACIGAAFRRMSFPQPEAGTVTVTYPIVFQPGD